MNIEEELQRKTLEINYLRVQSNELQKQMAVLQQGAQELKATILSLGYLDEFKKGALLPLGAGVFCNAQVTGENVLVDVGAHTMVQKTPAEAKKILEDRAASIEQNLVEVQQAYLLGAERAEKLAGEFNALVQKSNSA